MRNGDEAKGGPATAAEVDAHTIFVRNLPYTLSDTQLESIFSEIGPVRHCFTVKTKGSDQHRGFGFVQFAVTEDALKAVQEKNGALLESRKIKVEVAKRRAPLDVRHPKQRSSEVEQTTFQHDEPRKLDSLKSSSSKGPVAASVDKPTAEVTEISRRGGKPKAEVQGSKSNGEVQDDKPKGEVPAGKSKGTVHDGKPKDEVRRGKPKGEVQADSLKDGAHGSSKQIPARTVVVGGLASNEMLEAVLAEGTKAGPVESIQKTFTELELTSRGLAKDGCKPRAAAIVFLSVKAACKAVAALHQKTIGGGVVWARQLGGEGSKSKQLRLIVRNLPFQVTEAAIRDLFSPAGFLWEVTIPRKPDGLSKGFAFVGFTSKADAQKAIQLVNGKKIGNRPLAVDWAVAKKQYEAAVAPAAPLQAPDADLDNESDSTASESEDLDDEDRYRDSESDEKSGEEPEHPLRESSVTEKQQRKKDQKKNIARKRGLELISETRKSERNRESTGSDIDIENIDPIEEVDMMKKILNKVVTSTHDQELSDEEEVMEALQRKRPLPHLSPPLTIDRTVKKTVNGNKAVEKGTLNEKKAVEKGTLNGKKAVASKVETIEVAENEKKDESEASRLNRTVFLRNLPTEAKVPELRKLFSQFGEIKSFRLVLHPITKKSKGNAFLEYSLQGSAKAAVSAAKKTGAEELGLILKGRSVSVTMAVDKDSARKLAKETFHKQVEEDKRNLVLAKEGQILANTPSAAGVSKSDMSKRLQLENEKATKLRSPNFHVSRTRLSVHNFPKTMSEKELKSLFVEAVKSRASKQIPVIKQVKILRDENTQKSRAAAFVEFDEHQHALVALRVLNNNPDTFGSDHRPIVEFAIENSLILRKRAANAMQAKTFQSKGEGKAQRISDTLDLRKTKKRKPNGSLRENSAARNEVNLNNETIPGVNTKAERKRKRTVDQDLSEVSQREKEVAADEGMGVGLNHGGKRAREFKKGKTSGTDRKKAQAERASRGVNHVEGGEAAGSDFHMTRKPAQKVQNTNDNLKDQVSARDDQFTSRKREMPVKVMEEGRFNNFGRRHKTEIQAGAKKSRKDKKVESQDRLDKLVAEYRTKYFSGASKSTNTKDPGVLPKDMRRWFE